MIKCYNQGNLWEKKCIGNLLFPRVRVHHGGVEATLHMQHEAAAAAHRSKHKQEAECTLGMVVSLETSKPTLRGILHPARAHLLIPLPTPKLGQVFKCKPPGKCFIHTRTLSEHSQMSVTNNKSHPYSLTERLRSSSLTSILRTIPIPKTNLTLWNRLTCRTPVMYLHAYLQESFEGFKFVSAILNSSKIQNAKIKLTSEIWETI